MTPRVLAGTLGVAAAIAAALVAMSLLSAREPARPALAPAASPSPSVLLAGVPQEGTALGDPAAPRTLAVYEDVQCPFCARWNQDELPAVVEDHVKSGRLRLVFHGLAFIGPESELGLRAVLAAGLQDRLWDLLELMYVGQGAENSGWLTGESLRSLGAAVPGLDVDRMLSDLHDPQVDREIAAAAQAASAAGVRGTPSLALGPTGGALALVPPPELAAALAR